MNFINDNIYNISNYQLPMFDLCITSPTYSWENMGFNPFNDNEEFMGGKYGFGYDHSYCLIYEKKG